LQINFTKLPQEGHLIAAISPHNSGTVSRQTVPVASKSRGATMRSSRSSSHQRFADAEDIDPYHEDQDYEEMRGDRPRGRWRRRIIVLTLIAVGAYAYRTYYIEPASTKTPPVIAVDETPSKVIPASSDRQSGKLIQERVGALGSRERAASREQQSVEPNSIDSTSRWALPSSPLPPQGTASVPDTRSSDPKRITTLTIRPDGTEASAGRAASPPPNTSASATPSQPRPAQSATRGAPASDAPPRTAATAPPATAANAAGSGYVVQVSSQRSEADAQASLRSLQEKFRDQFGGRTAVVRRADLGAKGIYYRVVMGPFAAAGEADQFCSSFKAAGGQCIVQRN
jgi:cell division protein FtsN